MKGTAKVGGRPAKNDPRRLGNYVGILELRAVQPLDPFILAAIYRALFGGKDVAVDLRRSIAAEANQCAAAHGRAVAATSLRTPAKSVKAAKTPPEAASE
jgi:hypothetical protein